TLEELVTVATLTGRALEAAHRQHILHRDVKPANLLVQRHDGDWQVKLIDFGLALRQRTVQNTVNNLHSLRDTATGSSLAGTLEYMPPEQMGRVPGVGPGVYSDI